MNTDSKLKRFIVLLDKAPFVLFLESPDYVTISVNPLLRSLGFLDGDATVAIAPIEICEQTSLRRVFAVIDSKLPDPLAYDIIEALATNTLLSNGGFFPKHYFTANEWQKCVEWQNVDAKPTGKNEFTIVVAKFTHEIRIFSGKEPNTISHDGVINLHSPDSSVPFPLSLLKECVINIHDIIVQASIGRTLAAMTESKYLSVMQTGHDTFNYINMKKVEKDLRTGLEAFGIEAEKPTEQ